MCKQLGWVFTAVSKSNLLKLFLYELLTHHCLKWIRSRTPGASKRESYWANFRLYFLFCMIQISGALIFSADVFTFSPWFLLKPVLKNPLKHSSGLTLADLKLCRQRLTTWITVYQASMSELPHFATASQWKQAPGENIQGKPLQENRSYWAKYCACQPGKPGKCCQTVLSTSVHPVSHDTACSLLEMFQFWFRFTSLCCIKA